MRGFFQRNAFLLRFALLSSFMGISVGLAKFTTTLYALHLGAQGGWLAAIAGAQSVGILFMSIPVGFWVERLGPARLFVSGSLVMGALYAAIPLLPHTLFLVALTALISFVMPLRFVSLNTVFMAALERIGHARAGWQRGAHMAGMFLLGPMLAAGVVALLGHAGSYWLIAAMFVLTARLSSSVLSQHTHTPPRAGAARLSMRQSVRALWREPEIRVLAMQECAIQAIHMYYAFYMVVIAVQELGLPALGAGSLVAVQGSAFVATLIFLGPLLTWLGPLRTVLASVSAVTLAALLLAWASTTGWLWVGGVVLGAGLGLLQMHTLTQFAHVGARLGRGRVSGLSALAGPCGGFVGGLLGGTLGTVVGLQAVFLLFVPVFWWLGWHAYRESTRPTMFLI
ncbi:MFS transporter [Rhodoferax saidenbachensis]|uniref:MFS family permease n=1 Tax=Rhodoferax saidenbachensis TaxID=1484693 RepID=A0ABU1ZNH3_9BURK|nr:MFS transporter [Rhodoferax saidenbachensis]MDR7307099.1 MFS family permease [Rhodoferax saidenbachensis]